MRTVSIRPGEDTIRLGQLLKLVDAVPTGAQVKDVLFAGARTSPVRTVPGRAASPVTPRC